VVCADADALAKTIDRTRMPRIKTVSATPM
jgi:hypothetical protein